MCPPTLFFDVAPKGESSFRPTKSLHCSSHVTLNFPINQLFFSLPALRPRRRGFKTKDPDLCRSLRFLPEPTFAAGLMSDASRLKATVYVGGLDSAVTTQTLHAAFVPFGEIADIQLPKPDLPSATEPHRGFAYVEFEQAADAREAVDNMDQSELYGRVIKVAAAKPQKEQNEGLGSKTAVWEQVSDVLGFTYAESRRERCSRMGLHRKVGLRSMQ